MAITRTLVVVYTKRVMRSAGRTAQTHNAVLETWRDASGSHRRISELTLCGLNAAKYTENSTTPVFCAKCRAEARKWETHMSVWQSRESGRLHWLRRCSGGPGVPRVRRVSVDEETVSAARADGKVCRCMPQIFRPGRRAWN